MSVEMLKIIERLDRIERRLEALHEDVRRNGEQLARSNLRRLRVAGDEESPGGQAKD